MMKHILLLTLLVFFQTEVISQNSSPACKGLFCSDKIINLQLELYFDSLLAGGTSEKVKYSGKLKLLENNLPSDTFNIHLSKRGHFRKFPNICDFPPLRIHFNQKETKGTEFADLNKIKIVTHCQNNDTAFEQYIIQEYLIYKAYNLLTDYSFKARLAKIRYKDLSKTFPDVNTYTFFIENPGSLETRLNGTCLDTKYIYSKHLDQKQLALMTMFQYMIINQDWSISLTHNLEIFAQKPNFKLIPIPFDFDMCGVIAIPYKSPTVPFKKGIKPERNFMGQEIPKAYIFEAINTLKEHKAEIINVFASSAILSETNKANIIGHIQDFYDLVSNNAFVNFLTSGK
jgi:hypothetical protein